jgi:hypothetical protein
MREAQHGAMKSFAPRVGFQQAGRADTQSRASDLDIGACWARSLPKTIARAGRPIQHSHPALAQEAVEASGYRRRETVAMLALSMLITYERARAESLGFVARGGLMERAERMVLLGIGLAFNILVPVLWLMLALTIGEALASASCSRRCSTRSWTCGRAGVVICAACAGHELDRCLYEALRKTARRRLPTTFHTHALPERRAGIRGQAAGSRVFGVDLAGVEVDAAPQGLPAPVTAVRAACCESAHAALHV